MFWYKFVLFLELLVDSIALEKGNTVFVVQYYISLLIDQIKELSNFGGQLSMKCTLWVLLTS